MPTYRVITLGCKVNHYESLQVEQLLQGLGYAPTRGDDADVVVVNTCSVTASAAAKSRNILRRHARRERKVGEPPHVIAIGCWATSDRSSARELLGEGSFIGHDGAIADQLPELLQSAQLTRPAQPTAPRQGVRSLPILHGRQPQNQRAVLKVQDGCDAHCTYCIIPKLRPSLWSRPADEVVAEARNMVAAGHQEIVLAGVFLGAYGQETALHRRQQAPAAQLARLVELLCTQVPGLLRLRLSSLESGDATPELIGRLKAFPQVMPHFHLPLQSGSDAVLRKMNRQYSSSDYLAMVKRIRQAFDRPALTTDIIVGFPGESDEDFRRTTELVETAEFLQVHAFPFSPREGTAAARWRTEMVPQRIATERLNELQRLSTELSVRYRSRFIGQTVELLVEHPAASERSGVRQGRSQRYFAVHFESGQELTGQRVSVQIDRVTAQRTIGTLVGQSK